jgi:hypothetical protein
MILHHERVGSWCSSCSRCCWCAPCWRVFTTPSGRVPCGSPRAAPTPGEPGADRPAPPDGRRARAMVYDGMMARSRSACQGQARRFDPGHPPHESPTRRAAFPSGARRYDPRTGDPSRRSRLLVPTPPVAAGASSGLHERRGRTRRGLDGGRRRDDDHHHDGTVDDQDVIDRTTTTATTSTTTSTATATSSTRIRRRCRRLPAGGRGGPLFAVGRDGGDRGHRGAPDQALVFGVRAL